MRTGRTARRLAEGNDTAGGHVWGPWAAGLPRLQHILVLLFLVKAAAMGGLDQLVLRFPE